MTETGRGAEDGPPVCTPTGTASSLPVKLSMEILAALALAKLGTIFGSLKTSGE